MYYKLTYIFLLLVSSVSSQNRHASQSLKALWEKLPVDCRNELQLNKEYSCNLKGVTFGLKREFEGGKLMHLGLNVFNDSIQKTENPFVYSFIERELLQYVLDDEPIRNVRQKEEKVFLFYSNNFQKRALINNLNSIKNVVSDLTGVIIKHDSLSYRVLLVNSNAERLEIEFPKINTLIRSMDKKELDDFIYNEFSVNVKYKQPQSKSLVNDPMKREGNMLVSEGEHYLINGFTANTYYKKEQNNIKVLFEHDCIGESFSNLFLTDLPFRQPTQLELKIRSYGGIDQTVFTTIAQFLAHFDSQFKLFFGVESDKPEGIRGSLIIYCPALNYIHLLDVKTTEPLLFGDQVKVSAVMYPYIPCHNIKELFGKTEKNKPVLDDLLKGNAYE